jgi:hypothetical protein
MDLTHGDRREPFLQPSFPSELGCFTSEIFEFLLDRQVAEAERYGNYTALLLFQLKGTEVPKRATEALTTCLSRNIRASDFLALLENGTLAVVLLNATVETAERVLKRLEEEALLHLSCTGLSLKLALSSACYPSEAANVNELKELARSRLSPVLH